MNSSRRMPSSLAGHVLIATPQLRDPHFARSVVYVVAHTAKGAMGLVINKPNDNMTFPFLSAQLGIPLSGNIALPAIHHGGPVDTKRGFVLHSKDYRGSSTSFFPPGIGLTTTPDVIKDIARGKGPRRCLLALGCASWRSGQIESEIERIAWLHRPADERLLFDGDNAAKWRKAVAGLGFDIAHLSPHIGHA